MKAPFLSELVQKLQQAEALLSETRGALARALAEESGIGWNGSAELAVQSVTPAVTPRSVGDDGLQRTRSSNSLPQQKYVPAEGVVEEVPSDLLLDQVLLDDVDQEIEREEIRKSARERSPSAYHEDQATESVNLGGRGKGAGGRKRWCVPFNPEGYFRLLWDSIGMVCILYDFYMIPLGLAFKIPTHGVYAFIATFINCFFLCDVLLNFATGYRSDSGVWVYDFRRIRRHYCRGMLTPDVISSIPWEWLPLDSSGQYQQQLQLTKLARTIRLLRLFRLLRVLRLGTVPESMKIAFEVNPSLVFASGVFSVIMSLISITHWTACMWYALGTKDELGAVGDTWVTKFVDEHEDMTTRYMHSLYFALTVMTTVGFGDISPQNKGERAFMLFLLLIASISFAILMGKITDLIGSMNSETHKLTEKMQMLGQYMRWRNVPPSLFMAIRKHLHYVWDQNKGYDEYEDSVKDQLPPVLRKELFLHIYGRVLRSLPFLSWLRDFEVCIKELANLVDARLLAKGDVVFHAGEKNDCVSVLRTGSVWVSLNESLFQLSAREDDTIDPEEMLDAKHLDQAHIDEALDVHGTGHHKPPTQLPAGLHSGLQAMMPQAPPLDVIEKLLKVRSAAENHKRRKARVLEFKASAGFRARVLYHAADEVEEDDWLQKEAACKLQRLWRARHRRREQEQSPGGGGRTRKGNALHSKSLAAPAYFGESCLWQPVHEWEDTKNCPIYKYNVRCQNRVELMVIDRRMIRDIIDRFDPWLFDRFEFFRSKVVSGLKETSATCRGSDVGSDAGSIPMVVDQACVSLLGQVPGFVAPTSDYLQRLRLRISELGQKREVVAARQERTRSHFPPTISSPQAEAASPPMLKMRPVQAPIPSQRGLTVPPFSSGLRTPLLHRDRDGEEYQPRHGSGDGLW